jgi:transcription termination factor Rho
MSTAAPTRTGVLEMHPKGHGFLRDPKRNFKPNAGDAVVGPPLLAKFQLKQGVKLTGVVDEPTGKDAPKLLDLVEIEGRTPDQYAELAAFDDLTPVDPHERIRLEVGPEPLGMRVMDLLTPIGKGQRGLIVAPPRTGKTILLQQIAASIAKNHPEMYLLVLLVDERPEEVTDFRRSVPAEIWASSNDEQIENHIRIADLCIERAKRLVEAGKHVVLFVDSITRLSRAHNTQRNSGRTGSGGLDVRALERPRQLFAAARNTEEAGSLTIIASVLVETGSRMDDVIFQEFKGTGNMELVLDRKCAEMRLWPAINVAASGTRKEELLIDAKKLEGIHFFRRALVQQKIEEATETMIARLSKTKTNDEFLKLIAR